MKQQTTNVRYQQQAELDVLRDTVSSHGNDLLDFKRHSTMMVQQLQAQVSEVRTQLTDFASETAQQRRIVELEQRSTGHAIGGLDSGRRTLAEQVDRLRAQVSMLLAAVPMGGVQKEQTQGKLKEVDNAMSVMHGSVQGLRQELTDTKQDWKGSQDLLGKALGTLSEDFADFQKHTTTVLNKLQSGMFHIEEVGHNEKDRLGRMEAQLSGIHHSLYSTTNDLLLLKGAGPPSKMAPEVKQQPASPAHSREASPVPVPVQTKGGWKRPAQAYPLPGSWQFGVPPSSSAASSPRPRRAPTPQPSIAWPAP
jgi:chromosome segregation ATPase